MKRLPNNKLIIFGSLLAMGYLSSCKTEMAPEVVAEIANDKIPTVLVVTAEQRSFQAEILITGTALPNQTVMLYAMESGVIQTITVNIGDRVAKGDIIATLANPELVRLEEKIHANLDAKTAIYSRLKTTLEQTPDLTPIQLVDLARADYEAAKADEKIIANRLDYLNIRAPFSGIITQRLVDHGATFFG